jgi:Zn-dependent metalloprotease
MCIKHKRNPIQCILPPYIADRMKDSDTITKEELLDNELRNNRFRSDRNFFANLNVADQNLLAIKKAKPSKPKPTIEIHNLQKGYSLPGKFLMTTAQIAKDKEAKHVHEGVLHTWNFYHNIFNRNSIDNAGKVLVNSIHYGKRYNNAMWNGRQMVFGDGDKKVFNSFTEDIDIIGHELAHAVTQYSANLMYEKQSGALNESFSDVFGIMIKQYALHQDVHQSNWLIGENIMIGNEYALRSMIAPGTAYRNHPEWDNDPQPATMDDFVKMANNANEDYGGVHYNSGIPNFAFCMAAKEVGGFAWETVGKVWYAALTKSLKEDADFIAAKKATIAQAITLFGKGSKVHRAVVKGWRDAKV